MDMARTPVDPFSLLTPDLVALLERHGLLQQLAARLVVAEAVEDLALSEDEQEQVRQGLCQQLGLKDPGQLETVLADKGWNGADTFWNAELPLRLQKFAEADFLHKAEARFLDRKTQLDQVVYSLLRVQDPFLAKELYLRIAEGEANFADLAAFYAEGPEKATNGVIGPVPLTQAHPALAEVLRTSQPGDLHEPLQIENWFLVIRLESYKPATLDEATKAQMANELLQDWANEEASRRISVLKAPGGTHSSQP
jgi:parvulin-like peptidyl-prolyl isomerase